MPLAVVLAGIHGHGRWHLRNLERLRRAGIGVRLAGVCDVRPPDDLPADVPAMARLDDLLDAVRPDITIVCTPIHTHAGLTLAAAAAGSAVLLEKPPTPTLAAFERLGAGLAGRACQVGFQSLGSHAIPYVRSVIAAGAIGTVTGIGAAGAWQRDASYYGRAAWAGRRTLDGAAVVDGVLTNPLAHATATALALDGEDQALRDIEVELFRANPIEADDTSCLRLVTSHGTTITVAATLCAERTAEPYVIVHGTRGRIVLSYTTGRVLLSSPARAETTSPARAETTSPARAETTEHPATDLLENLVAHIRSPEVPLLVPLSATRPFMEVVEAVRLAPEPRAIPGPYLRTDASGAHPRRVVPGIDAAVAMSAERLALFSELDLPWAARDRTAADG